MHVLVGYAFALNLLVRLVLAFSGPQSRRWSSLIPGVRDIKAAFREQLPKLRSREGHRYAGHSPLGKISIFLMVLFMVHLAGVVLAEIKGSLGMVSAMITGHRKDDDR